ncbi:hypothetical protein [Vibrio phage CKB-S2]|nr:hypothetical protein [Vibrio phage CKB-S2]
MGQAALVPILIATTVAQVGVSLYQSKQQTALMNKQAREQQAALRFSQQQETNRIKSEGKEQEIDRLRALRATIGQNIVAAGSAGILIEGTPSQIIESNIEAAREDISIIQGNVEANIAGTVAGGAFKSQAIESGRQAGVAGAKTAGIAGAISGIGGGASSIAGL